MKDLIRAKALELGFDLCAFTTAHPPETADAFQQWIAQGLHGEMAWLSRNAHKRVNPDQVLPGAKSFVLLATSYALPISSRHEPHAGVVARYAQHADYHDLLAEPLRHLSAFIDQLAGPGHRSLWYVDTGPILERDLAQRAGLGFVGKHTNLISRKLGNWIFLSEIITTAGIEPDAPEHNRCGSCHRCLESCPTGALTGAFQLDARRCISYLTIELKGSIPEQLRPLIGNRIYGCDDCLAACPWNRFARAGRLMAPHRRDDLQAPDLVALLQLDGPSFKARFAGSPMLRTKRRGLLRNVCVALGNIGGPEHLPPLQAASQDPEPLIAEHAQWAIKQIEQRAQSAPPVRPKAQGMLL
ncbi:MAG TPA: tRNA epoxyqueuosine(34) reductase QueG [Methylomirabilota bacterium]|nr:tRNA epoxyqueuosine(34) reductase QueG [Methylomirabilota bacterium]